MKPADVIRELRKPGMQVFYLTKWSLDDVTVFKGVKADCIKFMEKLIENGIEGDVVEAHIMFGNLYIG